ncbi:MAG: zinc ABC transporter substrate-binding protein [Spirochaetia bacterium]
MSHNPWRTGLFLALLVLSLPLQSARAASKLINVVAAENFYGNIVAQLGGGKVHVTSILSDPNVDPHEYESSVEDAKAIAEADLVIENGGGYDDWMDKLLSASPRSRRVLLTGFAIAPHKLPDNEHVWYSVDNVLAIAQAVSAGLKKLDPGDASFFSGNLKTFSVSLSLVRQRLVQLRGKWNGTPVGLTETIFLYQAEPLGLKVLTPFEFQKAIAEGNDPPADTVVAAENQVKGKKIKVLIYNEQTASPITTKLQEEAKSVGIPVVPVTETMPSALNYQDWMLSQLAVLEQALEK